MGEGIVYVCCAYGNLAGRDRVSSDCIAGKSPPSWDFCYPVCHVRKAAESAMLRSRALRHGSRISSNREVYTLKDINLVLVVACGIE